jgi:hypothetical protein
MKNHLAAATVLCAALQPTAAGAQIEPAGDGMFLCRSPVVATGFWNDLNAAASAGVKLNRSVAASIAAKHGCSFVSSKRLKPVRFVAGQLGITEGSGLGWASPELYIIYLNNPPAAPASGQPSSGPKGAR